MSNRCSWCGRFVKAPKQSSHWQDCPSYVIQTPPTDELHDLQLAVNKSQRAERVSRDLWRVNSSDGRYYLVQRIGHTMWCSCKGYTVRKHCSHSTLVKATAMRLPVPSARRTMQLVNTTPWAGEPAFNPAAKEA